MFRFIPCVLLPGLLSVMLLLAGCSRATPAARSGGQPPAAAAAAPLAVQVAPVQRGALSDTRTYVGNVQARQQVTLVPKVAGRVTKLAVDVGSAVKAGDVLVELDRDALVAQVAQAEAGLAAAAGRLNGLEAGPRAEVVAQAEANVRAARERLAGLQAGPRPEQVAQAAANLKAAQARLDQLKAGPTEHQVAVAEAQIRLAKNQLYLVQAQGDALLGSRLPNTYTKEQKEAQSGVAWEQGQAAAAQLAQLKAGPTAEQLAQAEAAVEAAAAQLQLATNPLTAHDLAQAEAAVAAAEQQLALAKRPVTEYDLQVARAAVAQAKAAVDLATVQLAEATILAPFAGVVAQRMVAAGAMAGPTTPLLTLISRETEVVVNVDEGGLAVLRAGQAATVTVSAYPGEEFKAAVASIAPSVDARSRTIQVRLAPTNGDGKLRDGMFAQVQLQIGGGQENALLVPRSAVVEEGPVSAVYVATDGKLQRRVVTPGLTDGAHIEVVEGVAEGERIAVSGLAGLKDGAEVAVR